MMRLILVFVLAFGASANAQMAATGAGLSGAAVVSGYTGPGDIFAYTSWYGIRAYNGAVAATGTQKALTVRRTTDSVTCDILIATTGDLGKTISTCNSSTQGGLTPVAFAGTDATAAGAITGTTLTMTATLHVCDQITGGTTAAGTFVVSGSSPTWTVNLSQTVASATLTATVGLAVSEIYDQVGTNHTLQASTGSQPCLLANTLKSGTLPTIAATGSTGLESSTGSASQPFALYGVAERYDGTTSVQQIIMGNAGAFQQLSYDASTNTVRAAGTGGSLTKTATDSTLHFMLGTFNGASSLINVDGAETTGDLGGTGSSAPIDIMFQSGGAAGLIGFWAEAGLAPSAPSVGNRGSLRTNVSSYWGTP